MHLVQTSTQDELTQLSQLATDSEYSPPGFGWGGSGFLGSSHDSLGDKFRRLIEDLEKGRFNDLTE